MKFLEKALALLTPSQRNRRMPDPIIVYGTSWCGDSRRAKKLMDDHQIVYQWIDIDSDMEGRKYVESVNHGFRSVPTILFPDGSLLVEPTTIDLKKKLGIEE